MRSRHLSGLLVLLIGTSAQAAAHDVAGTSRWRPKDGVYAVPGSTFTARCEEQNGAFIELGDNSLGGDEYICSVRKMTGTAPDILRIEATCDDPQTETSKKQIILLKRLDETTILWRQVTHGSKDPGIKFSYCPDDIQRSYRETSAHSKAEAERKAAEERAQQKR